MQLEDLLKQYKQKERNVKDLYYVCSPLSSKQSYKVIVNMSKAKMYEEMVEKKFNCRAIAPHSFLPRYLNDNIPEERQIALDFGISVLSVCKKIVVCGDVISSGMAAEIKYAEEHGIDIIYLKDV